MRKPIGITYPLSVLTETAEEKEAFNEVEKQSKIKQMSITHPSREAKLIAEVTVLTEMVRVLSDRVNQLEKKQ